MTRISDTACGRYAPPGAPGAPGPPGEDHGPRHGSAARPSPAAAGNVPGFPNIKCTVASVRMLGARLSFWLPHIVRSEIRVISGPISRTVSN